MNSQILHQAQSFAQLAKTEHIRSISPKTLKIARKNGALPFTCCERGMMAG